MSIDRHKELKERTKAFTLRVFRMSQALPKTREANVIMQQLLRSSTSIASNYRAAGRARSKAEFISKLGVVVEEADETVFGLEFPADTQIVPATKLHGLFNEANQFVTHLLSIPKHRKNLTSGQHRSPDHPIARDHPILKGCSKLVLCPVNSSAPFSVMCMSSSSLTPNSPRM